MATRTEITVIATDKTVAGSSSSAEAFDWATNSFPQAVELAGLPEKFNGGIGFSRWQKKLKLWLDVKGLWPVVEYEKPVLEAGNSNSVKGFARWNEKNKVARAAMLASLSNTLFDVYSSETFTAKLLWEKVNETHKELDKFEDADDEHRAYLMDMGIKALRRYYFLITFRSYLYCTCASKMHFSAWMDARPELGHLCSNLRID